ncbi:MAG: TrkH family potassium uptake protein [Candidatus Izemoplasmataceae bacterium]
MMKPLRHEYREIGYTLGLILSVVGVIFIIPISFSVFENVSSFNAFIIPFVTLQFIAFLLYKFQKRREKSVLTYQQGAVSVVLAWLITMTISTLPFMMLTDLNFTQAMFESVSGWTTTGLSMLEVESLPKSLLIYRSILQFAGGFGLVAIMISSLIGIGTLSTLYESEGHDQLLPNIKKTAQVLFVFYSSFMVFGTLLYVVFGMPLFEALNHAMSAVSTGGFSVHSDSIGYYNNINIEVVTMVLMLLGSINFAAYILIIKGKFKLFKSIDENRFMVLLFIPFALLLLFLMSRFMYMSLPEALRITIFEGISALTTTGYSISSYSSYPSSIIIVFIMVMIIGGQSGSTSGGIKLTRINLIIKNFRFSIIRIFQPEHQITDNIIKTPKGIKQIHKEDMNDIYNYMFLYLFTLFIGTLILTIEGFSLQDSLFEYASTLGTVGLSVGITSTTLSYLSYWSMIIGMFLGRLEFMVVLIVIVKLVKDGLKLSKKE